MSSTNDNDNDNSIPNNKIPIKDESKDYYEIEKSKDYIISKFGGTKRTLLSTIISSIYTLTFFILLIYYNEKKYGDDNGFHKGENDCIKLKKWNRVLYIGLGISFIFFIICTILQIKNQGREKYVSFLLLIRTVFNYIVGLFFLISITCAYFTIDNISLCPTVKYIDLAYIIVEWIIFSTCIILHYAIVIFFVCCKAKRKYWDGSGEVDPEEMKKVI